MILVLTYHKVLQRPGSKAEFYTITEGQLARQLELLSRSGLRALAPEDLRAPGGTAPAYLLTFDDATVDHYEVVLPLLARYDCRGIFFMPSAKLNRPGYLSDKQAAEISRAGHTLGLHSHEHRRLDWLSEEDIRVQMELSIQALALIAGKTPDIFAPPGGYIDRRVRAVALEQGVQVIRTMRWGYNRHYNPIALQCVPVNRFFTEADFERALSFRGRPFVYAAKEVAKRLVPTRAYEKLRALVFGWSARN